MERPAVSLVFAISLVYIPSGNARRLPDRAGLKEPEPASLLPRQSAAKAVMDSPVTRRELCVRFPVIQHSHGFSSRSHRRQHPDRRVASISDCRSCSLFRCAAWLLEEHPSLEVWKSCVYMDAHCRSSATPTMRSVHSIRASPGLRVGLLLPTISQHD